MMNTTQITSLKRARSIDSRENGPNKRNCRVEERHESVHRVTNSTHTLIPDLIYDSGDSESLVSDEDDDFSSQITLQPRSLQSLGANLPVIAKPPAALQPPDNGEIFISYDSDIPDRSFVPTEQEDIDDLVTGWTEALHEGSAESSLPEDTEDLDELTAMLSEELYKKKVEAESSLTEDGELTISFGYGDVIPSSTLVIPNEGKLDGFDDLEAQSTEELDHDAADTNLAGDSDDTDQTAAAIMAILRDAERNTRDNSVQNCPVDPDQSISEVESATESQTQNTTTSPLMQSRSEKPKPKRKISAKKTQAKKPLKTTYQVTKPQENQKIYKSEKLRKIICANGSSHEVPDRLLRSHSKLFKDGLENGHLTLPSDTMVLFDGDDEITLDWSIDARLFAKFVKFVYTGDYDIIGLVAGSELYSNSSFGARINVHHRIFTMAMTLGCRGLIVSVFYKMLSEKNDFLDYRRKLKDMAAEQRCIGDELRILGQWQYVRDHSPRDKCVINFTGQTKVPQGVEAMVRGYVYK